MQETYQLTIELPLFQMEILKRAAGYNQVSPEQFILNQLRLGAMERWFDLIIRDAAQGSIAKQSMVRCERCQVEKFLGEGATLCGTCKHEFPGPCSDEVHRQFASLSQSDNNENFHCAICNKWIVREMLAIAESNKSQYEWYANHLKRQYVVPINEETFDYLKLFVDEIIATSNPEFASRLTDCLVKQPSSIDGISGFEVEELRDRLENFLKGCKERTLPDDPSDRLFLTCFISSASQVVGDIKQAVCEQSRIWEYAST